MKYTIKSFRNEFPNDDVCLDYIFQKKFGKEHTCPKCGKKGFYRIKTRKVYSCSWCAYQLSPTANTIFHKSPTPLTTWFEAMYWLSQAKNGISALELSRTIGVTYKCAYRIHHQLRKVMEQGRSFLEDTVEADETYIGGKGGHNKRGRGAENKTPVFGMVQRKAQVIAKAVKNVKSSTVMPIMKASIKIGTNLMTDEYRIYNPCERYGFRHQRVDHGRKEYVRGNVHTNTIEGFWSQLKRSIHGTYHSVSPKYLQAYLDEFAFRYNLRSSSVPLFEVLMARVLQ